MKAYQLLRTWFVFTGLAILCWPTLLCAQSDDKPAKAGQGGTVNKLAEDEKRLGEKYQRLENALLMDGRDGRGQRPQAHGAD